jgi:transposase InsO family protein
MEVISESVGGPSMISPRGAHAAPTIGFDLLYVLVIIRLERRNLVCGSTSHLIRPRNGVARQIIEAFPWTEAPRYLIRDRDRVYGAAVTHRLRAMGIRDRPIAPGSPWQKGFAERLIGSIRRECVDHIVVLGETHRPRTAILRRPSLLGWAGLTRRNAQIDPGARCGRGEHDQRNAMA